jgi:hypothetical protein
MITVMYGIGEEYKYDAIFDKQYYTKKQERIHYDYALNSLLHTKKWTLHYSRHPIHT